MPARGTLSKRFRTHLGTLTLMTENFSKKKSVVLVNARMDLLKRSCPYFSRVFCPGNGFSKSIFAFMEFLKRCPYFSRVFCPGNGFSKSIFAFLLKRPIFFLKSSVLTFKGKGS